MPQKRVCMSKYFIDTNIFIRYYLNDDEKLSLASKKIIDDCVAGKYTSVICSTTLLEIVWVLKSFYKQPRDKIINFIEKILEIRNLIIIDRNLTEKTFSIYKLLNIDITDSYFCALMEQEKISEIFSFDHDFNKIKGVKRIEAMT